MEEEHRNGATTTVLDMTQQGPVGGSPGVPMTPQVPEHWPIVPVLAVNKHPVFPKFIKIVEVTDERLVILLRRNVKLNQPYAGVFVKKDDQNTEDTVKDPEELYPIGSFVQIVEMQDFGNKYVVHGSKMLEHNRLYLFNIIQVKDGCHGTSTNLISR